MSVHSMRIPHTADTEEKLLWLGTQAPAAAGLLADAKVDPVKALADADREAQAKVAEVRKK